MIVHMLCYFVDICDFGSFGDIHTVNDAMKPLRILQELDTGTLMLTYFFLFSIRHFKGSDPFDVMRSS